MSIRNGYIEFWFNTYYLDEDKIQFLAITPFQGLKSPAAQVMLINILTKSSFPLVAFESKDIEALKNITV